MPDTTTTLYGFTKPEDGASEDTWGGPKLNANLDSLDAKLNQRERRVVDLGLASVNPSVNFNLQTERFAKYTVDAVGGVITIQLSPDVTELRVVEGTLLLRQNSASTMNINFAFDANTDVGYWEFRDAGGTWTRGVGSVNISLGALNGAEYVFLIHAYKIGGVVRTQIGLVSRFFTS